MPEHSLTGGCLCGGVRFELTAPARDAGYCHCTRCQRRTGTGASAQARIDGRTFRLVRGEELVKGWRHPDARLRRVCRGLGADPRRRSPRALRRGEAALDAIRLSCWRSGSAGSALLAGGS
jgi:hypothetical protein